MKQIVRINEAELKTIIKESVSTILNEIGYRGAALTHGANYNAQQDYYQNMNVNARSKMDKSEIIRFPSTLVYFFTISINFSFCS